MHIVTWNYNKYSSTQVSSSIKKVDSMSDRERKAYYDMDKTNYKEL